MIAGNHDGPFDVDWYLKGGRRFLGHDASDDPHVARVRAGAGRTARRRDRLTWRGPAGAGADRRRC